MKKMYSLLTVILLTMTVTFQSLATIPKVNGLPAVSDVDLTKSTITTDVSTV